jgi:hypothetical protein
VAFDGKPIVPVKWTLDANDIQVPLGWRASKEPEKQDNESANFKISIPGDAKAPSSPQNAILPFPPPLVRVALTVVWSSYRFTIEKPVECAGNDHGHRNIPPRAGSGGDTDG